MPITRQQLLQILPKAGPVAGVSTPALNTAMGEYQIITPQRIAAFLAQVGHESGGDTVALARRLSRPTGRSGGPPAVCTDHPAAANQIFLVSGGVELSISEIVQYLAEGMGKKARLLTVPVSLMRLGTCVAGKQGICERLCGSLVIDSSKARNLLSWQPPLKADEALKKAGREGGRRITAP